MTKQTSKKIPKVLPGQAFANQHFTPSKKIVVQASVRHKLNITPGDWVAVYAIGDGKVALKKVDQIDISKERKILEF